MMYQAKVLSEELAFRYGMQDQQWNSLSLMIMEE